MPLSRFTCVDLLIYQADPLELFSARLYKRTDLIQYLRTEYTKIYKERARRLACKRRRISL